MITPRQWLRERRLRRASAIVFDDLSRTLLANQGEIPHRPLDCCTVCGLPVIKAFREELALPVRCKEHSGQRSRYVSGQEAY